MQKVPTAFFSGGLPTPSAPLRNLKRNPQGLPITHPCLSQGRDQTSKSEKWVSSGELLFSFFCSSSLCCSKSYVVYFGGHSHRSEEALLLAHDRVVNSHYEFLGSFLGSKQKAQDAIFYSYTKYINGFAADLEEEEAMEISSEAFSRNFHHSHAFPPFTVARLLFAEHAGVTSVFPSRGHTLHTTRSWDFLGLERNGSVPPSSIWAQ
ncbi:Peptidase inhibitor I9 [Musa troglodytarum]|uniref:Peptidase inhibitor I9 n=1 Tax=Musa troglodytarum TaxID=320322 RepID=A0A9E7JX78_9LILI|nr:Peptidase inhibitor I9 [Musa troglodytarum]